MDTPLNFRKIINTPIEHSSDDKSERIESLLKTYFFNITHKFIEQRPDFILSCFQEHKNYIKLSKDQAIDINTGEIIPVKDIEKLATSIDTWPESKNSLKSKWKQRARKDDQKFEIEDPFRDVLKILLAKCQSADRNASVHDQQVAISTSHLPEWGKTDPYAMGLATVDQCYRTLVAKGANPDRIALSCTIELADDYQLGQLVEAIKGLAKAAECFGAPLLSVDGSISSDNDSLAISIKGVGIIDDKKHIIPSNLVSTDSKIAIIGMTGNALGGSVLAKKLGLDKACVPNTKPKRNLAIYRNLYDAIKCGWIRSAHDIGEGGLATSLATIPFENKKTGLDITIDQLPIERDSSETSMLFAETPGRLILEIDPKHFDMVEALFGGQPFTKIGDTTGDHPGTTIDYKEHNLITSTRG